MKSNDILRGPDYVIILSSLKIYPILRGPWLCDYIFQPKNLSHSEGTWLCDYCSPKIYPILSNEILGMKSHSEGTWLCDYTFSQKSIPFWGELLMWLYFRAKNLSRSEETWLYDCILRNEFYCILRGPDYVIILSSLKSIPFWVELTTWL